MKYHDLIRMSEGDLYEYLATRGLIHSAYTCYKCYSICLIESKGSGEKLRNKTWRCKNKCCRKRYTITKDSFFEGFRIEPKVILYALYLYCLDVKRYKISEELEISSHTLRSIFNKLYDRIISASGENNVYLGRHHIVEVDETHVVSRRDERGRINAGERYWILGLKERNTGRIILKLVRNRNANICEEFIFKNVFIGSTVISDCWGGYSKLWEYGYDHKTINHKESFVDPRNNEIHTQNVESLWNSLKKKMPKFTTFESIDRFVRVYEYQYMCRNMTSSNKFDQLLDILGTPE